MKKIANLFWAAALLAAGISMNVSANTGESLCHDTKDGTCIIQSVNISEKNLELGSTQNIEIGIEDSFAVTDAVLHYQNQDTGKCFSQNCEKMEEGTLSFAVFFENDAEDGTYRLEKITVESEEENFSCCFREFEAETIFYVSGELAPESQCFSPDSSEWMFEIPKKEPAGLVVGGGYLSEELIIVLDPGHDDSHAGAYQNGLKEEKINLAIALYCKEELEKYSGITVYMTRDEDGSCPYPGRTAARCNEKRVEFAKSVDADIYVSLHNNSSTSASVKGAIVYYPNTNYNREVSDTGKGLARKIQDRLVALGLYNHGISMKYSADYQYPDGSTADYYAIIRNSKLEGIPAIIVEHAFMSNASDAQMFLSSNTKLKALGVADARAIIEYYGLESGGSKPEIGENVNVPQVSMSPVITQTPIQTPAEGQIFVDVYNDWYSEYVQYVYDHGIMNGIKGTFEFRPEENVTKAQVAQVLYNMEGMPEVTDRSACSVLKDVYEDWYTDAVCWAYHNGVVTGDKETLKFSPNANVKREELALMLYRYAKYKDYNVKQTSDFEGLKNAYKISSWAMDGMKWAVGAELIGGVELKDSAGNIVGYDLLPQGTATRAQLAAILTRFCEAYD